MAEKGKQTFIDHYTSLFGDRTLALLGAMKQSHLPVFLVRPDKREEIHEMWHKCGYSWRELEWFPQAIVWPADVPFGKQLPGSEKGWLYPLSPSSLFPVSALNVQPEEVVLDACAAPGGKTIAMSNFASRIIANDVSGERVKRLTRVVKDFGLEEKIETHLGPAEYIARHYPESFDKILIDAPCSSEAHVWRSKEHLAQWSHKRIEQLHTRQVNLIQSLIPALKPNGRLVYSTCAITPEENEATVARINTLTVIETKRIWPDTDKMEPIFFAVFEKTA